MNAQDVFVRALLVAALVVAVAGCGQPAPTPPAVRSVRTIVATASPVVTHNTYAGEVRPRYESGLGFRVAGKIRERLVDIGDRVEAGAALMRLDERDLALGEEASRAAVRAQEARFEVEKADFERYARLAATRFISQAEFERQKTHFEAARAELEAVRAEARVSGNRTGYSVLRADSAGTVTTLEAEAGQVVAAGQIVLRLARAGEMEVEVDVPEHALQALAPGMPVAVTLWATGEQRFPARIRELASSADPATRTYGMRVSVPEPPPAMRLGMTATVEVPAPASPSLIRVPLPAYTRYQDRDGVWIVDEAASTVAFRPVEVVGFDGNELLLGRQVQAGERVVTAGASLLHQGQAVRLLPAAEGS